MEAASTVVNEDHPLLATEASGAVASVYFIRQKASFRGVMGAAVSIRMAQDELLKVAKGQYTLVRLKPWEGLVVVRSWSLVGSRNTMTKVEEQRRFSFEAGKQYWVLVQANSRSAYEGDSFVPVSIDRERAAQLAADLTAVGAAVGTPLSVLPADQGH